MRNAPGFAWLGLLCAFCTTAWLPAGEPVPAVTIPDGYSLDQPPILAQGRVRFVAVKAGTPETVVYVAGTLHVFHRDDRAVLSDESKAAAKRFGLDSEIQFTHGTSADGKPLVVAYSPRGIDLIGDDPGEQGLTLREGGCFGPNGNLLYYAAVADGKEIAVLNGKRVELDPRYKAAPNNQDFRTLFPNQQRTDCALVVQTASGAGQVITQNHVSDWLNHIQAVGWNASGNRFAYTFVSEKDEAQLISGTEPQLLPPTELLDSRSCQIGPDGQLCYTLSRVLPNAQDPTQNPLVIWGNTKQPITGLVQRIVLPRGGSKFAFVEQIPEGDKTAPAGYVRFVVGEKAEPAYENIEGGVFSPDTAHFAYLAKVAKPVAGRVIVRDGRPSITVSDARGLAFSPDSNRLVYRAQMGGGWFLFDNDQKLGPYTAIDEGTFDPVTSHYQCTAQRKEGLFVLNGTLEIGPFEKITGLSFGPSGEPFFWGHRGAHAAVYLGTHALTLTDGVVTGENGCFELERKNSRTLVLSDGSMSDWDEIEPAVWSPDRKTPVIFGRQGEQHFVQVGPTLHPVQLTHVDAIQFAPDGKGLWVMGRNGRDIFVLTFPATPWSPSPKSHTGGVGPEPLTPAAPVPTAPVQP